MKPMIIIPKHRKPRKKARDRTTRDRPKEQPAHGTPESESTAVESEDNK